MRDEPDLSLPIAEPEPTPATSPAELDAAGTIVRLEPWREFLPAFVGILLIKGGLYSMLCGVLWYSKAPSAILAKTIATCVVCAILAAILCGCMVSLGQMLTPIRIGSSGSRIRKLSSFCLRWDEISEIREWRFLLFPPYLTLKTLTSKRLSLPAYLIHRADFTSAILTHAPADNRLRRYLDGAQS